MDLTQHLLEITKGYLQNQYNYICSLCNEFDGICNETDEEETYVKKRSIYKNADTLLNVTRGYHHCFMNIFNYIDDDTEDLDECLSLFSDIIDKCEHIVIYSNSYYN